MAPETESRSVASAAAEAPSCPPCPPCEAAAAPAPDAPKAPPPAPVQGPKFSLLFHLVDKYEPVSFSHEAHVGYADKCASCHHQQTEVEGTPPCRECHGTALNDTKVPGLKAAYHRQCMGCHREYGSGPLACEACHPLRGTAGKAVPEPEKKAVAPSIVLGHIAKEYPPVTFNHELHTEIGEACTGCHHHHGAVEKTPPCRECHNTRATAPGVKKLGLEDAYHGQCIACHRKEGGPRECNECHVKPAAAATPAGDAGPAPAAAKPDAGPAPAAPPSAGPPTP